MLKHHPVEVDNGVKLKLCIFLILALDWAEWSCSCPSCFTDRNRAVLSTGDEGGCIMYWWHISEKIVINFKMNLFNNLEYLIVW